MQSDTFNLKEKTVLWLPDIAVTLCIKCNLSTLLHEHKAGVCPLGAEICDVFCERAGGTVTWGTCIFPSN